MEEKNNIPFPQANDFDKVLKLLNVEDERYLQDKEYLISFLGLGTDRQILYYLSACEFLGLVDKERRFTDLANRIRKSSEDIKNVLLCKTIVSKPVFGEVFFLKYLYNEDIDREQISQLINDIYGIDNIAVCDRRAATVSKWLDWVYNQTL